MSMNKHIPNFTSTKEDTLVELIKKYDVVKCKKTDTTSTGCAFQNFSYYYFKYYIDTELIIVFEISVSFSEKNAVWQKTVAEFNALSCGIYRDWTCLITKYENFTKS